ncbi:hypothetical protein DFJ67_7530 [Asanoa ferruginea]|uniref:Uncharacterized protein n=1 Tax=Asanoa ferruginea TaxID=53367 RepID=A0A3D9ZW24_9ACTN|nr:hypothetical protein [Asanoa ferruginea]REG01446.1 hypothetical protein DFJ67_7530 [Asanoa ferruginea]GIF47927.1 hypothetical protein Afe04nite_24660 [Asanoa ferruginea]
MKTLAVTLVLAAVGVAVIFLAPSLVAIGIMLVLGAVAIGARALYRHWQAANRP